MDAHEKRQLRAQRNLEHTQTVLAKLPLIVDYGAYQRDLEADLASWRERMEQQNERIARRGE
jgi:hypothetical protein